jgi:hypothetical protein
MYTCPCCGYEVFESPPGSYDICPICFWEDDALQLFFPLRSGGANRCSLAEAQVCFVQFGACERTMSKNVRLPEPGDRKDPLWFPLWERKVEVPDHEIESSRARIESSVKKLCYWLRGT